MEEKNIGPGWQESAKNSLPFKYPGLQVKLVCRKGSYDSTGEKESGKTQKLTPSHIFTTGSFDAKSKKLILL